MPIRSLLLAGVALAAASAAHAQTSRDEDAMPANIIVTAPMEQREADVLSGTSTVSGAELTRSVKPTIGETRAGRKSDVSGKRVSVRVDIGGRRNIKKKNPYINVT